MSNKQSIWLLVENRAEELMAEGIFSDFVRENLLRIKMCWEAGSVISFAETILLQQSTVPVALILNCNSEPDVFRAPAERILSRDAPRGIWHVALAIPDMTTWLRLDSQFAAAVSHARLSASPSRADIAVFFKDWWMSQRNFQFNREEVSAANEEFAQLNRFVAEHAAVRTGAA